MAEIELQRKNRSPWAWILVVLILAVGVWAVAEIVDTGDDAIDDVEMGAEITPPITETPATTDPAGTDAPGMEASAAAVDEFLNEARGFAATDMGRQHEATSSALLHLIPALAVVTPAAAREGMQNDFETLRQAATNIAQNAWTADTHANQVREAFIAAADLMRRSLDQAAQPPAEASDQVDAVRQAAESLAADQPLLDQRDAVANFFNAAASAIESMRSAAPMTG